MKGCLSLVKGGLVRHRLGCRLGQNEEQLITSVFDLIPFAGLARAQPVTRRWLREDLESSSGRRPGGDRGIGHIQAGERDVMEERVISEEAELAKPCLIGLAGLFAGQAVLDPAQ